MRFPSALLQLVSVLLLLADFSAAQAAKSSPPAAPPDPVISPEVYSDGTVTFRFRAPNSKVVKLAREGAEPEAMQKDDQGVWSLTVPLAPDYYGYTFVADGVRLLDPSNYELVPNLLSPANFVHVPGPSSFPWELNDVPHGVIHHHYYKSEVAQDNRDYYIYTPPGYDTTGQQKYPVLYLLHGYSDDASGWTAVGRANVILDNLITQGKAKPMIVVMPLGYGTMDFVRIGREGWSDTELRATNFRKFTEELLTEVMPRVETEYRVNSNRNSRAIAGLSMGGSESLLTGLNNLDRFSWIGAFSSGGIPEDFDKDFPALDVKANPQLHLLWIACGTEDQLITVNRNLREWLKTKRVQQTEIETPGAHTWMVWRRNLTDFAQLIFR